MAGGVPAGTLSIEIVAEIAKLQEDMRKVQKSVGDMATGVGKSTRAANDNIASIGAKKAGIQQLSAQFSDLGVQITSAAGSSNVLKGVLNAFAMQGPQIVAAISMMRGSATGFMAFLAGPWGAAIMAAVSVLGILGAQFLSSGDDAEKGAKKVDIYTAALNRMMNAMGRATAADIGFNKVRLAQLQGWRDNPDADPMASRGGTRADMLSRALRRRDLDEQISNLQATIAGTEKAVAAQKRLDDLQKQDAASLKDAAAARRAHNKELREAEKAARDAAREYEKLVKWISDARAEAQGGVGKLANDMIERQREWGKDWETWNDADLRARKEKAALQEAEREGARQILDIYLQQLDAISQMGGMFRTIAGLLHGIATGDFSRVTGPIGALLSMPVGVTVDRDGRMVAKTIGDELKDVFGKDSEFFKGLSSVLADAGTGNLAAGMFGLNKSATAELGSSIGGAIGGKVGEKFLTKGLGDFAGPLGSIAGGLIGGVVGGLFKKVKWGAVDLSADGVSASRGNSGTAEKAAVSVGENFMSSLNQIAEAFGGDIGDFGRITIGQRHGDWRVNTGGTSLKKKKGATDFDDDVEGAIAFALQTAIERGAITGIRASTQKLLQATGDLQTKLSKALSFEGVFSDLRARLDPTAYALEQLTKKFDGLREIFAEAGATTEEYAQLEQLLALQRKDIMEEASQKVIDDLANQSAQESRFLELIGRDQDALALSRLRELAAMKGSLRPMQAMIYQLEDARGVIEKFGPLAANLRAFRDELLGGTSDSLAFVTSKFRATASSARSGDADALAALQSDATAFLDAARANAASELEYRRALGEVLAATDGGIFAAESQVEYAQMQIDAIAANTNVLSGLKAELAVYQQRLVEQGEWVQRQFRRWDSEGIRIQNDSTTPIFTEAA
ncbi:hypothetical protein M527_07000 [Sphingobium indicum IP26]|uniref:Bacteriophage tail tape measure N-terminal domain-containing protein n=1 Tax=Sphingobium indicum F2 TaxID=1450518 RepID=A0A8E0WSU2_9SPHN|nr:MULTISPECIES: hypothetical protein [Sphingobium]EPR09868.1 hypothetical protein M527_07000 [Sphingobium indicum IP26]EQB04996.1 hypothetical protein L286_09515 [Sphingobium sp. HDIP04]KER36661.1 hypothetical protein AL00_09305 [Sphingobium indicum F2]